MIVYNNTKAGFINDVRDNVIADKIEEAFKKHHINHNNQAEFRSWYNSLQFVRNAIDDNEINEDCNLAIEYQIPLTSKRVDFLIAGCDEHNNNNVVVIELKQWENSETTCNEDLVRAFTGNNFRTVTHPSYQAYSYAKIIENFNENVSNYNISIIPCAFLHNYKEINRHNIDNEFYSNAISYAPIFLGHDTPKLRNFIKKYIRKKDNIDILMKIENGKLKPAKALQDALVSMLEGNKEFYLIDEQKVAYEKVKELVTTSLRDANKINNQYNKYTIIVEGGPGTGKSVVAIQLLCDLIQKGYSANYVTKNSAPREVYFKKLRGAKFSLTYIKNLFKGSGSFTETQNNYFDCLLCDEAHRLNEKSGIFKNKGVNQIKEIIHSAKVSVFFIDENQIVTTDDIGSVELIKKFAKEENSIAIYGDDLKLASQFRCNGSDGYLAFLDNLLEIRQTANYDIDLDYDFRVFDSPTVMMEFIKEKNKVDNKSRMLAGYCYDWITKKNNDPELYDICLEDGFMARWNFSDTKTWAIDEKSVDQIGCIHTSQGLEFNYVGVIIGRDLIYRNGRVLTDYTKRAKTDKTLVGIKKNGEYKLADTIIRNTYRVLLSRGQKGCYVYCEDKELGEYIKSIIGVK